MGTMEKLTSGETVFEISSGYGHYKIRDKSWAIQAFRPLEEELKNSCTTIHIPHHLFRVEAALVAKRALMGVRKTLRDVRLLHYLSAKPLDEAVEVMSIFSSALEGCTLRSLTLGIGELGERGFEAFAPLLKSQKTLENLEFVGSHISGKAARAICELLPSFETIKSLLFSGNETGDDAARAISELVKKCIALEDFCFTETRIGIDGAMALAEAFRRASRLKMLCLEGSTFGKAGGVALSKVISGHLALTEVFLGHMDLHDKGVIAIAGSLKDTAPSLSVFIVSGNHITPKAAPALAECLAVKNMLTEFCARDNKLKDVGSIAICEAISEGHEQLKKLDLSSNKMTKIGAKAAAEAVANKPDFIRLCIFDNSITKKGMEAVKDVLRKGTKGEHVLPPKLDLDNMDLIHEDSDTIMELLCEDGERSLTDSDTDSESLADGDTDRSLTDSDTDSESLADGDTDTESLADSDTDSESLADSDTDSDKLSDEDL